MSTCKITYNGNEISAVDETAPVSVAYNSATIATLNDGNTKTLGCHGKVMGSDVVIGSKTLNCNGKLMQGDIVVELAGSTTSGETWYFNREIGVPMDDQHQIIELVFNFESKGASYAGMRKISKRHFEYLQYVSPSTDTSLNKLAFSYMDYAWMDAGLRTIVLDEPATGDVLAFLEANATKLS